LEFSAHARLLKGIFLILALISSAAWCPRDAATTFSLSFDPSLGADPVSGRIILMLSKTSKFSPTETGTPFFGLDVNDLEPGVSDIAGKDASGYPIRSLSRLPAGECYDQAFLKVYTTFHRSDGHTIRPHNDQGEGQNWRRSPGNRIGRKRAPRASSS
jgi:hypothetical protein